LLVECTGEQYQKFRMDVLPEAIWLKDAKLKGEIAQAYKESRQLYAKDIRMLLGRTITEPDRLTEIINGAAGTVTVPDYASQAEVEGAFSDAGKAEPTDFSQLLEGTPEVPAEAEATEVAEAEQPAVAEVPAPASAPVQKPVAAKVPVEAPGSVNFDDLLK